MSDIRILEVKDREEGLKIRFTLDGIKMSMSPHQTPSDTFVEALDALKADVLSICELPKGYDSGLQMIGISLSRKENEEGESVAAVISAKKDLREGPPLSINTPKRYVEAIEEGTSMLPQGTIQRIRDLCRQAELYIKSLRHLQNLYRQQELGFGDEEAEEEQDSEPVHAFAT